MLLHEATKSERYIVDPVEFGRNKCLEKTTMRDTHYLIDFFQWYNRLITMHVPSWSLTISSVLVYSSAIPLMDNMTTTSAEVDDLSLRTFFDAQCESRVSSTFTIYNPYRFCSAPIFGVGKGNPDEVFFWSKSQRF